MNEHRELLEDLRALAALEPREAPKHLEERLRIEFRRRNRRRKLAAWIPMSSIAAAAAAVALFFWAHQDKPKLAPPVTPVAAVSAAPALEDDTDASFYPLPEAEALPAVENAMVVRVQLPVSSLQLMGVPVAEERAGASVQADLLLGQDGLARAVRLVQ